MIVIKIEHDDHTYERIYLIVQTDKKQAVDYGYIGSTKHTFVSRGAGFVSLSMANDLRVVDYKLDSPEMWDYIQRITEDPELRLVWTTIDDDSKCIKLSDHIDLYEGLREEDS